MAKIGGISFSISFVFSLLISFISLTCFSKSNPHKPPAIVSANASSFDGSAKNSKI